MPKNKTKKAKRHLRRKSRSKKKTQKVQHGTISIPSEQQTLTQAGMNTTRPAVLSKVTTSISSPGSIRTPDAVISSRSQNGWRMQAFNLFLTYPTNDLDPQVAMQNVLEKFGSSLTWAVVAQEHHQDEALHLHMLIKLNQKYRSTNPTDLDQLGGSHGNYQGCRNVLQTLKYVTKESNYVSHQVDVKAMLEAASLKKNTKSHLIATKMVNGATLASLNLTDPGYVMLNLKKLKDYQSLLLILSMKKAVKKWVPIDSLDQDTPEESIIADWLNTSLVSGPGASDLVQINAKPLVMKHLWLTGSTGIGKSHMVLKLAQLGVRFYQIPKDEDYYDLYEDGAYDLALLDEYRSHKTIQWLNQWTDGTPMLLKQKGSAAYIKKQPMHTLILSNYSIEEAYCKSSEDKLETLHRRFDVVDWLDANTRIDLFK